MKNIAGKKIICKKCEIRIDKKNVEKSSDDITDFVHTSGIFPNVNEDYCPKDKTPLYPACPNCIVEFGIKLQKEELEWIKKQIENNMEKDFTFDDLLKILEERCRSLT
jgi:hypothetical protein